MIFGKRLLILTGPQGSGNHMWSKIFQHPEVTGWDFEGQYWKGHHEEPFNKMWHYPSLAKQYAWHGKHFVTSISCPYVRDGINHIPDYVNFIEEVESCGIFVEIAVLGRDHNILKRQQRRVRGGETYESFIPCLDTLMDMGLPLHFLSMEQLELYRGKYLKYIKKQLDWPIDVNRALQYLENANEKYITDNDVNSHADLHVKIAIARSKDKQ